MKTTTAVSSLSSLSALRGAVGGVVDAADAEGWWDRLVWLWRILSALDGLMATLWAIVDRLRAGEIVPGGVCPAGTVAMGARPVVAGSRPVRRRVVADRCGVAVVPAERARPRMEWGWRDLGLVAMAPIAAARLRISSESGWRASRSCAIIVPD